MADGIKISEFEQIERLQEGCCLPVVSNNENKRITFSNLAKNIALLFFGSSATINETSPVDVPVKWNDDVVGNSARMARFMRKLNQVQFTVDFTYKKKGLSVDLQEVFKDLPSEYTPAMDIYFSAVSSIKYLDYDDDEVIHIVPATLQLTKLGKLNLDCIANIEEGSRIKLSGTYLV